MRRPASWLVLAAALLAPTFDAVAAAADAATLARGNAVFTHRCSMCHREGGTGSFILARRLGAAKSLLEKRTDLDPTYVRTVVRWGLVNMPRISRVELPDADMDALVAYLTAPKAPATP
jgi:mono/diheme cytochrome c family protein